MWPRGGGAQGVARSLKPRSPWPYWRRWPSLRGDTPGVSTSFNLSIPWSKRQPASAPRRAFGTEKTHGAKACASSPCAARPRRAPIPASSRCARRTCGSNSCNPLAPRHRCASPSRDSTSPFPAAANILTERPRRNSLGLNRRPVPCLNGPRDAHTPAAPSSLQPPLHRSASTRILGSCNLSSLGIVRPAPRSGRQEALSARGTETWKPL